MMGKLGGFQQFFVNAPEQSAFLFKIEANREDERGEDEQQAHQCGNFVTDLHFCFGSALLQDLRGDRLFQQRHG